MLVEDVVSKAEKTSTKIRIKSTPLWHYFALTALILYFIDAGARRLKIISELKSG